MAPRIRTAIVAAMLLAQIALPALHGLAFGDEAHAVVAAEQTLASAAGAPHASPAHDASACPVCLASRQTRTGVIRALLNAPAPSIAAPAPICELQAALPGAPELDCASPRAPPIPALVVA